RVTSQWKPRVTSQWQSTSLGPQSFRTSRVEVSTDQFVHDRLLLSSEIFRVNDRGMSVNQFIIGHGGG
ncbi:hypothetical protein, partial [Sphingobium yanoikuyae]|uniref:hypothetical protein n=1 Tax=Sphingobium yanoikuyae TaxID=13690 RepID=UPI001BE4C56C